MIGLEYGCTADPIVSYITDQNILDKIIQNDSKDDTRVVILCMVDNFGICHAPFAQGNFYLYIYYI